MSGFVVIAVAAAVVGAIVGRWIVVVPAVATWVIYVAGLKQGWWGSGVGDGWEVALVVGGGVAAFGALVGVLVRRGIRARWFGVLSAKTDLPRD